MIRLLINLIETSFYINESELNFFFPYFIFSALIISEAHTLINDLGKSMSLYAIKSRPI